MGMRILFATWQAEDCPSIAFSSLLYTYYCWCNTLGWCKESTESAIILWHGSFVDSSRHCALTLDCLDHFIYHSLSYQLMVVSGYCLSLSTNCEAQDKVLSGKTMPELEYDVIISAQAVLYNQFTLISFTILLVQ
jgi:hypothetical protein